MITYDAKTQSVGVGYKSTWDEIADVAEKLAAKEDLSIWRGGDRFGSVEEYAAYAYFLGTMDAMRDISVYIKLENGKVTPNVFFSMRDFSISADPECVNWRNAYGDWLVPTGVEQQEDFCQVTLEYES
jgi:hypothetical protein|tara:strand:- start:27 stop:410 length:384 start_codon:yes stop_codon:yes gene_type:complete